MLYLALFLLVLGLSLLSVACRFFRKPGVALAEVALRAVWFSDPKVRLHRPGRLLQWLGLLCLIGAGLVVLSQQ